MNEPGIPRNGPPPAAASGILPGAPGPSWNDVLCGLKGMCLAPGWGQAQTISLW